LRAGILSLGLAGLAVLATSQPAIAGSVRIALLPVVVHSAEADTAYLQKGLGDMLASRIERTPGLSVVRPAGDEAGTNQREAAVKEGRTLGAQYVVYGSFTQFGTGASLDIRCAAIEVPEDADANPRKIFVQTGSAAEIIPKLDDLSDKIGRYVLTGGPDGIGREATPAASAATAPPAAAPNEIEALRARVERLEKALYDPGESIGDSGTPVGPQPGAPPAADTVAGDGGTQASPLR